MAKRTVSGLTIGLIVVVLVIVAVIVYSLTSKPSIQSTLPSSESNTQSAASANTAALEGTIEIKIKDYHIGFDPAEVKIKAGSRVTWINQDNSVHTVTSDSESKELDSENLLTGQSYWHTFNTPGVYNYHCTFHPMKGKIVVV